MRRAGFRAVSWSGRPNDFVAFRFIAGNDHPDHDTIATFRKRFLKEIEALFVRVLMLAKEMGVLQMGTVALDGAKIHANAKPPQRPVPRIRRQAGSAAETGVAELLAKAEAADAADLPYGLLDSEELALREGRLKKLAEARAKIEARSKERYEREKAEYEASSPPAKPRSPRWAINLAASRRSRRPKAPSQRIRSI